MIRGKYIIKGAAQDLLEIDKAIKEIDEMAIWFHENEKKLSAAKDNLLKKRNQIMKDNNIGKLVMEKQEIRGGLNNVKYREFYAYKVLFLKDGEIMEEPIMLEN